MCRRGDGELWSCEWEIRHTSDPIFWEKSPPSPVSSETFTSRSSKSRRRQLLLCSKELLPPPARESYRFDLFLVVFCCHSCCLPSCQVTCLPSTSLSPTIRDLTVLTVLTVLTITIQTVSQEESECVCRGLAIQESRTVRAARHDMNVVSQVNEFVVRTLGPGGKRYTWICYKCCLFGVIVLCLLCPCVLVPRQSL